MCVAAFDELFCFRDLADYLEQNGKGVELVMVDDIEEIVRGKVQALVVELGTNAAEYLENYGSINELAELIECRPGKYGIPSLYEVIRVEWLGRVKQVISSKFHIEFAEGSVQDTIDDIIENTTEYCDLIDKIKEHFHDISDISSIIETKIKALLEESECSNLFKAYFLQKIAQTDLLIKFQIELTEESKEYLDAWANGIGNTPIIDVCREVISVSGGDTSYLKGILNIQLNETQRAFAKILQLPYEEAENDSVKLPESLERASSFELPGNLQSYLAVKL